MRENNPELTPSHFDCDLVRNERRKLYLEMAEYFGGEYSEITWWNDSICFKLPALIFEATHGDANKINMSEFPELEWIKPNDATSWNIWFDTLPEGQQERSTALLLVYYAMDLADEGIIRI